MSSGPASPVQPTDPVAIRRRFLLLRGLRWLPTGALMPVLVLLLLDRGLTLGQIGLVTAAQGVVVLLLELPTGGLADTWGRRPVLAIASAIELATTVLLVVADTMPLLVVVFALQGVYRALESGPLDAWYVDAAQAADPDADIETGLARAGAVTGLALAAGTLAGGALVALDPLPAVSALVVPLLAAVVLRAVEVGAVLALVRDPDRRPDRRVHSTPPQPVECTHRGLTAVLAVVRDAIALVRRSPVLRPLLVAEAIWVPGMIAFEVLMPARLEQTAGSAETAAALMGPATAAGWGVAAVGSALVPLLVRRVGAGWAAASLRVLQGAAVVGIGVAAGPVGVVTAFVATMAVHGAFHPVHHALLHRGVEGPGHRATVVSVNGMLAQGAGALGGIVLGVLADATTLTSAVLVGALLLVLPAPLYVLAGRRAAAAAAPDGTAGGRAAPAAASSPPTHAWVGREDPG